MKIKFSVIVGKPLGLEPIAIMISKKDPGLKNWVTTP